MAVFGGWLWGLLAATRGSRRGLIIALGFDLLLWLGIAVGTLLAYCPSPCDTAWPLMEIANWANLLFGLLAAVAAGLHLRSQPQPRAV
jgi:pyruvate/2-oxoacid:ferredoxin oxidoreductase beta subunit